MLLLLMTFGVAGARVCYPANTTRTPYDILETARVETKRGCEVLCTANSTCVGISFKDVGLNSSCTLLSTRVANEICIAPTEIYLKQVTGCSDRTDITAEYGIDPCIDEAVPSAFRPIGSQLICTFNKDDILIIRAVNADGRRITLDNEKWNSLEKAGEMWAYRFGTVNIPIVAAMCVRAGSAKCPCAPLMNLPNIGYPALPDRTNPCAADAWLYWNVAKFPSYGVKYESKEDTAKAIVTCRAGMWLLWMKNGDRNWGVTGLSCYPV